MTNVSTAKPRHATGHHRSRIVAGLSALAATFALAACHFVGSGTVESATDYGRATFTFDLNCPTGGGASGVLTYIDPEARVEIHGVVPGSALQTSCTKPTATVSETITYQAKPAITGLGWGTFEGTYTPLNSTLAGGMFTVSVAEGGTNSVDPGFFCIAFYGGVYNGDSNSGPIQWGNIVETNS